MRTRATKSAVCYGKGDRTHKAKCLTESDSHYFALLTYALQDSGHKFYAIKLMVLLFCFPTSFIGGVGMWGGVRFRGPLLALCGPLNYKSANKQRKVLTLDPKLTGIRKCGMPRLLR